MDKIFIGAGDLPLLNISQEPHLKAGTTKYKITIMIHLLLTVER